MAKKKRAKADRPPRLKRKFYEEELVRLQFELVKWQYWVKHHDMRVMITFDGRDAAGKGGTIKRIMAPLQPRDIRLVALGKPSDREQTQWYFQRYVTHLPAAGEIVLFDRSWYNRATVERVMGFCSDREYWDFLRDAPNFERLLIHDGIILLKYWLSVDDDEQERRFQERRGQPGAPLEAQPDRHRGAQPLDRILAGERRDDRAHRYSRMPLAAGELERQTAPAPQRDSRYAGRHPLRERDPGTDEAAGCAAAGRIHVASTARYALSGERLLRRHGARLIYFLPLASFRRVSRRAMAGRAAAFASI